VVGASLAAAVLVYRGLIVPGGPLGWDESAHALYGLLIAHDLRQLDWISLLYDTYRQVYWPPLHSWLAGAVFLFTAPSEAAARIASVACLPPLALLLFLAARRMSPEHPTTAGLLAAWLTLTSPAVITYSSLCMLEMPGAVAVALTLLAYIRLTSTGASDRWHALVGLGVVAAFFAKTNYGILLGLALVVAEVTGARTGFRNLFSRRYFWTALPVFLALAVWFAYPFKLRETWEALVNQPFGVTDTYGGSAFLFYPRAWVRLSGSIWIAAAYLACTAAAVRRWRDPRIRLLVVLVALQFLIGELHQTKVVRHLWPVFPALFLLSSHVGASLIWSRTTPRWAVRGLVLALALHAGTLPWRVPPPRSPEIDQTIVRELSPLLRPPGNALAILTWDYPCPPCLDWPLVVREAVIDVPQTGWVAQAEHTAKVARAASRWPVSRRLLAGLNRYARGGTARTYYGGDGPPSAFLRELIVEGDLDRLAVVGTGPGPPAALEPLIRAAGLTPVSSRWVLDMSVKPNAPPLRLDIYRR